MAAQESIGGHELALTIINDGAQYRARVNLAIVEHFGPSLGGPAHTARRCASEWLTHAYTGAMQYERQFGTRDGSSFSSHDIIMTAGELAEYYERHVKEMMPHERAHSLAQKD